MRQASKWIGAALLSAALFASAGAAAAWAAPQDQQAPGYSRAEYDAYQAASAEKDPQQRIKLLDDFAAKYPNSTLMSYVYRSYYLSYFALKNYPQAIAYADKEVALGDKVDLGTRLEALIARAQAFSAGSADKSLQTPDAYTKARDAAAEGLKTLDQWKKPDKMTDEQFAQQKKGVGILFNSVAGLADAGLKDFKAAEASYKAALAIDPSAALTHYYLGLAYLQDTPPQPVDGYWELSRAIALKAPGDAQIRAYLRNQMLHYQQPSCEKLVDDEINQIVTVAASSPDRPTTLTIPSADDLKKAQEDTADFIPWLKEGSQHGQVMWLATCGLEYPDIGVKVLDVTPGDNDNVTLKVYRPTSTEPDAAEKEMEAATDPNMEVHVVGQPDAKRIQKGDGVRFTGTVTGYQQTPFLLTWDNGKINPDDIAPEKPAPGAKRPARKPGA